MRSKNETLLSDCRFKKKKKEEIPFKKNNILDILNESLNDFVFLSESSARANLIRIASGRNT